MAAAAQFDELTKATGILSEADLARVFDALPPVAPEALLGRWSGGSFDSGHPAHQLLQKFKWAGKDFHSVDDVDPIMVLNDQGERVWFSDYGHARLREVKFHGVVSAAMVYDSFAIIDAFRRVSDTVLMGAMDAKEWAKDGTYYFYLTKME